MINNTKQIVVPWSFVRCIMASPWNDMIKSGILVPHPSGIEMTTTRMFQMMFKVDQLQSHLKSHFAKNDEYIDSKIVNYNIVNGLGIFFMKKSSHLFVKEACNLLRETLPLCHMS